MLLLSVGKTAGSHRSGAAATVGLSIKAVFRSLLTQRAGALVGAGAGAELGALRRCSNSAISVPIQAVGLFHACRLQRNLCGLATDLTPSEMAAEYLRHG